MTALLFDGHLLHDLHHALHLLVELPALAHEFLSARLERQEFKNATAAV